VKKKENIFQLLTQKPWEPSQVKIDNEHDGTTLALSKAKLGVRTIIAVSTVIFSLMIVGYADRMFVYDWASMPDPWLLWVNTGVLIISSFFFYKVKVAADQKQLEKVKNGLLLIGFLAFAFLVGQLLVWQHLIKLGYYVSSNPANSYFYLFTAVHGLHLMGGLFFWGRTTTKFLKGNYNISKLQQAIELCATYWHFLLLVWLVLFGMMIAW
tara:strand:+ start:786 stop:1418 length:633 start_codon:yes stop_codon:yes gene_type:complete